MLKNLDNSERAGYTRKKTELDRLVREGKISRAQAKDRLAQSLADRLEEGRNASSKNGRYLDPLRRSSTKRKLPNQYLLTLVEPENYMSAIPDKFSLFPRTVERIKTSFTMRADASGRIGLDITGGPNGFNVVFGTATFQGTDHYSSPGTPTFSPYNWATFDGHGTGAATKYRLVASKLVVEYEGPLTDSAGRITCAQYPPDGGLSLSSAFDSISSYDYSYTGPVAKGCMQVFLPNATAQATSWYNTNQVVGSSNNGAIVMSCAGLTGGATPPAGADRVVCTVYQVYEFYSVDPILTGMQLHSPPSALADHANRVLSSVHHHEGGINGKSKHGRNTAETVWKYWKKYTWDQKDWMWPIVKEYGPYAVDFAIDLALAA